jgi:AcrR family transcriptional regulator
MVRQDDVDPVAGKLQRGRPTDAPIGSGDDSDLVHGSFPLVVWCISQLLDDSPGRSVGARPLLLGLAAIDLVDGASDERRFVGQKAITGAALRLFLKNGYDETTLDDIAAEADIARRTFFGYFKSKEEILHAAIDTGFIAALRTAFVRVDRDERPFDAVRRKLAQLVSRFESKESIAIERLIRSTGALWARKQVIFLRLERNLFDSLRDVWADEDENALRLVAMVGIAVMRLGMDTWWNDRGQRSLAAHVREAFATLKSVL